jgi:acetylornithine deacetylase
MPAEVERVLAGVDREAAIALLRALVAAQAEGEAAVQAVVADRLTALGARVERTVYDPAEVTLTGEFAAGQAIAPGLRASIVGTLAGRGDGRSLILFAHPDSEPVRNTGAWRHDPFAGEIAEGRMHGWGIADDLLGVAVGIAAMAALATAGVQPGGDVAMASTPSKRHARGVAAILHRGLSADAAIYLHPAESGAGLGEIKAFASGQLEFRITVTGRLPPTTEPGHTAFAHLAVNPIDKALPLIAALRALDAKRGASVHHPRLDAAVGRSTNLVVTSLSCGEDGRLGRIGPVCTLGGAVSFPPDEDMRDVQAAIAGAVAAAAAEDAWLRAHPPVITWVSGVTGMEIAADHPLYRTVSGAIESIAGITPAVNPMHTSSDIRNPVVQKGIPTVGFGPRAGSLTQVGGTDEWIDVADYITMIKVTAAVIVGWTTADDGA